MKRESIFENLSLEILSFFLINQKKSDQSSGKRITDPPFLQPGSSEEIC